MKEETEDLFLKYVTNNLELIEENEENNDNLIN